MTREEVIAKLATKFGHHTCPVTRPPDEDHRHQWTEFVPDGHDDRGTCMVVERDEDGALIRPLTYGEIADALTEA